MNYIEEYENWLVKTKGNEYLNSELLEMKNNDDKIKECFYKELEFGTAGLRGVIGAGTNRMNIYTVRKATQGFANYLNNNFTNPSIAISYDSRTFSIEFANEVASVMAGNNIKAYVTDKLMPTPFLSYMVRELGCQGGVMITASHNPYIYNGYKAYDENGCQLTDIPAQKVTEYVKNIEMFGDIKVDANSKLINVIGQDLMDQYIQDVLSKKVIEIQNSDLKVVFTPLNGAGNLSVRAMLSEINCTNVLVVKEQELPDGLFPTCQYPNPEMKEALKLGIDLMKKENADILLATDPDSDRVGVVVNEEESFSILTGNEIGLLLLDFIVNSRLKNNSMPKSPTVVKTIVSSKLVDKMCSKNNIKCIDVLTGFKYIGEQVEILKQENREEDFIFGYEESFGYLTDGFVRDKDAVLAAMHLTQMSQCYKNKGITLLDRLEEIYKEFGYILNHQESYEFSGIQGMQDMANIMSGLRENLPSVFGEYKINTIKDYENSVEIDVDSSKEEKINLPKSNIMEYIFENGSSLIIRPSGTEPKIKAYITACGKSRAENNMILGKILAISNKIMNI